MAPANNIKDGKGNEKHITPVPAIAVAAAAAAAAATTAAEAAGEMVTFSRTT